MAIDPMKLSPAPWHYDVRVGNVSVFAGAPPPECLTHECPRWVAQWTGTWGNGRWEVDERHQADLEFIALARNAFDVMLRRGWSPVASPLENEGWRVDMNDGTYFAYDADRNGAQHPAQWPDPFTALVEADAWWEANVEKGGAP